MNTNRSQANNDQPIDETKDHRSQSDMAAADVSSEPVDDTEGHASGRGYQKSGIDDETIGRDHVAP